MNVEDLKHIFKPQYDAIATKDTHPKLFFMLIDGDHRLVERYPSDKDLAGLVPMLSSFTYAGTDGVMPRFVK